MKKYIILFLAVISFSYAQIDTTSFAYHAMNTLGYCNFDQKFYDKENKDTVMLFNCYHGLVGFEFNKKIMQIIIDGVENIKYILKSEWWSKFINEEKISSCTVRYDIKKKKNKIFFGCKDIFDVFVVGDDFTIKDKNKNDISDLYRMFKQINIKDNKRVEDDI